MPDHLHAILSFPSETAMSRVVGDWKRYQGQHGIVWQQGYFDHRIRNGSQDVEKRQYIRMNPVRRELCRTPEEWAWVCEPWRTDGAGEIG
jgi:putative transposase